MADNPTGGNEEPNAPASGSGEWAPGAMPQFADLPEAPPEPVAPKALQQPGGPDMIQTPRFDPETGAVQRTPAPVAPPVAAPPAAAPPVAPPAAPVAPPVAAPADAAPQYAAPQPTYAQYAPPAYQPPITPKRKGVPWWVWLIIGVVVLVGVGVAAAVVLFLANLSQGSSPDYTGAPVEATDASTTTIVSSDATVAYSIQDGWVDATQYFDTSSVTSVFQEGQTLTGVHFTADPNVTTPQLVMVAEQAPDARRMGNLEDATKGYLSGAGAAGAQFEAPEPVPFTTASGLDGYRVAFDATISGTNIAMNLAVLGHGKRVVFVQWISYQGPVDTAAMDQLLDSVRIDE